MFYTVKNISSGIPLIKDADAATGTISGYFAIFGNEDSDGDTILQGAFAKTIKDQGPTSSRPRIKMLRNHSPWEPVGTLSVLKEDAKGLYYEGNAGTHAIGQDTIKMIESGLITEHSIGYEVVKKQVIDPDADWRDRKQILQEIKLWEGSLLTGWGANELTGGATIKSMGKDFIIQTLEQRQKSLDKFIRNSTATDETIEMLSLECKQLSKIILDLLQDTTEPETDSTLPGNKGADEVLNNFITQLNLQTWKRKNFLQSSMS